MICLSELREHREREPCARSGGQGEQITSRVHVEGHGGIAVSCWSQSERRLQRRVARARRGEREESFLFALPVRLKTLSKSITDQSADIYRDKRRALKKCTWFFPPEQIAFTVTGGKRWASFMYIAIKFPMKEKDDEKKKQTLWIWQAAHQQTKSIPKQS